MKKTTKRALLLSALSLLLCMAMLVGSTFAWFTDSVTSGRNTIVSGNLDVELYYATLDANNEWTDYTEVDSETKMFNENALYEPGYTEVVKFKVVNAGTLALKYSLDAKIYGETAGKNVYGDMFNLSNYLYTGTLAAADYNRAAAVAAATTQLSTGFNMKSTTVLNAGAEEELVLVLTMPTTVGNEANYKTAEENAPADKYQPKIDLGIILVATQATYEADDFNNQYDTNAFYPAQNAAELKEALATGGTVVLSDDIITVKPVGVGNGYGAGQYELNGGILDGNGKELSVYKEASERGVDYSAISTTGGTIKNLSILAATRGIFLYDLQEDVYIDNYYANGEWLCYCINTGDMQENTYNMYVSNSTLLGWTSFSKLKSATFTNCKFGQGEYYLNGHSRTVKPYIDTLFDTCDFSGVYDGAFKDEMSKGGFRLDLTALEDGKIVTLKNCTVNGVAITAANWTELVDVTGTDMTKLAIQLKDGSYLSSTSTLPDYIQFA